MQSRLPQVDKILRHPLLKETLQRFNREIVVRVLREILDNLRLQKQMVESEALIEMLNSKLLQLSEISMRKVINGTGVVLNTNLGRSPISQAHLQILQNLAGGYCNLEINLESGKRGKRSSQIEKLLTILTGAEASLAVNNNAAAVVLAVNCFALGKEVVVSRGELVEIGGSFRLPDVIQAAGGKLKEVGSTNRTRLSDFEKAINENTGLVMRCHRSNFELRGFTEETKLEDLAELCKKVQIPLFEDLGSGVLMKLSHLGLDDEPTVEESLSLGCDLVSFSGDKLLGGPQAGIIAGRKDLLERLQKHPLYRALRMDKIGISLLEQTLASYLLANPQDKLPSLSLIASSASDLETRVARFIRLNQDKLQMIRLASSSAQSAIGGGSLPGKEKTSRALLLQSERKSSYIAKKLRQLNPPVISITRENDNLIDFRTVFPEEELLLENALIELDKQLAREEANTKAGGV